jgi:hypothetical protein
MIPIELTDAELDAVSGGVGNVTASIVSQIFSQTNNATLVSAIVAGAAAVSLTQAVAQSNTNS